MKNKSVQDTSHNVLQKHSQATEEQIRVAKLSQMNIKEESHDIQIRQVSDITRKPLDIVSIALHDSNYDTQLAIQNIFEGRYDDQDEWKTTSTKKGKKSTHHSDTVNDKVDSPELLEENEQKPNKSGPSRGGGVAGSKGRSTSRNRKSDEKNQSEDRWDIDQDKTDSRDKNRGFSERGRSRGRGRGGSRGGGRGGRGGFGRGGGNIRGSRQQGRGGGRGSRRSRDNRRDENGFGEPAGFGAPDNFTDSTGFGQPAGFGEPPKEETWDIDEKTEDWGEEANDNKKYETDWSKDSWADQEVKDTNSKEVDNLFSQKTDSWAHVNGDTKEDNTWGDQDIPSSNVDSGKYVPEQIDTAVICSIPTSSTTAEVTSYQPTNDISRYINNTAASNQFPSSQQEGGLTSSLNERNYSSLADSLQQNISNLPMISGITESHKLEQEQRSSKMSQKAPQQKSRKPASKGVSMPVVMPRSAQMHSDIGEQFAGLEFGSEPVSPRLLKSTNTSAPFSSDLSNTESLESSITRQPVANLQEKPVIPTTSSSQQHAELLSNTSLPPTQPVVQVSTQIETTKLPNESLTKDVTSSLSAFKSLDVGQGGEVAPPHYLGSPGRGLAHTMVSESISFPSSTKLPSSPTSSSSTLDVFSRHNVLGTSVTMSVEPQQKLSSYHDKKVYNTHEQNIDAEKILADQKALAEKQFIGEQQRVLAEQQQREAYKEQLAFAEQKALAQQKLIASQRSKDDSENIQNNLKDSRKNVPDNRLGLPEAPALSVKDSPSKNSTSDNTYSNKSRSTNSRSISSPPGLSSSSVYASKSNELLSQVSSVGSTSKTQSKASSAPPGMLHPNLLYTAGVQTTGMLPYQQFGYNYDELLQLQRHMHLPQSPYHYDVSTMYPTANAAPSRDGISNYQGGDSKFARGTEESTAANLHQANAHVAASNMNAHQAYLNAGQIPYGFTYAYQPGVMPQAGLYPAFTAAPSVFQLNQGKGVVGTQYQSQYAQQQQQSYNTGKYSGAGSHDFPKGNYHSNSVSQATLSKGGAQGVNSSVDGSSGTTSYKPQSYNDGKGFLGTSPSSQPTMTLHGQTTHVNPFLLAQQQQQQQNLLSGQVAAGQMGHQVSHHDTRTGGHQVSFSANQPKRDVKGNYQSYWSGSR